MTGAYLNNAAVGYPPAPGVVEAVVWFLNDPPRPPGRASAALPDPVEDCRQRLAGLLGVNEARRVVFTANATTAINLAILGLDLPPGSLVLTTAAEHNAVLRPLSALKKERGIRLAVAGLRPDGALDEDSYEEGLRERPALVVLGHVSNVTGAIVDALALLRRARRAGAVTLLDAAQSAGRVPLAAAAGADMVALAGHKVLHGPSGAAALYVCEGIELKQVLHGAGGSDSELEEHPAGMPQRLEAGARNWPALAGLDAALKWFETNGGASRARAGEACGELFARLGRIPGVRVFGRDGAANAGICSFRLAGWSPEEAALALDRDFGVVCSAGLHCAPLAHAALGSAPAGTLRFSVSGFTRPEEIETACRAVEEMARCAR